MPPPPEYEDKINEPMDVRKARLLYQSRKRGMTENGLLLRYEIYIGLFLYFPIFQWVKISLMMITYKNILNQK